MIRRAVRWVLAALYVVAGVFHLVQPATFLAIMPGWVLWPPEVVALTGVAELAGAAALVQPWSARLRRAGGVGLALYALCVWPANVNHMLIDLARPDGGDDGGGLPLAYHVPRLAMQPLIIWAALWAGEVLDWPFGKRRHAADRSAGP